MNENDDGALRVFWVAAVIVACMIAFMLMLPRRGHGQEDHHPHHAQYQGWQSNSGFGCCNNRDCGELPEQDVRERGGFTEVLVKDPSGDVWVQVLERHLIRKGTGDSPDWSVNHACILESLGDRTPQERLVCFMPAAKF